MSDTQARVHALRSGGWEFADVADAVAVSWWTVYRWSRGETEAHAANRRILFALPIQKPRGTVTLRLAIG